VTRARTIAGRILRLVARTAWLVVRVLAGFGVVRWALAVVGVWPTAAGLAAVSVVWGLCCWQRLERRLDARERRLLAVHAYLVKYLAKPPGPGGRAAQGDEHVAFARAPAAVSARYLAHCEDQAVEQQIRTGEAWR
jgi:hypothetical protein